MDHFTEFTIGIEALELSGGYLLIVTPEGIPGIEAHYIVCDDEWIASMLAYYGDTTTGTAKRWLNRNIDRIHTQDYIISAEAYAAEHGCC